MTRNDWLIVNIDDQDPIRYAKTRTLRRAGFEVVEATSGFEGLDAVDRHRPGLVLCDVKMPDVSGLDLCQIIKERYPGTLVLQISATFVTAQDRAAGLNKGADAYLTEPVAPEELLASVRALLRLKEYENQLRLADARREFIYSLAKLQRSTDSQEEVARLGAERLSKKIDAQETCFYRILPPNRATLIACWPTTSSASANPSITLDETALGALRQAKTHAEPGSNGNARSNESPGAFLAVPLLRHGQLIAVMYVHGAIGHEWTDDEVTLSEEVAELTWDAVERARAASELRVLNETLEERVAERTAELAKVHELLRQSQKMEALGQLTGGIAHDFNNLLTGIIGGVSAVRRRIDRGDISGVNQYIEEVINSAFRAANMIDRLLVFSRRQALDVRPIDVNNLIQSTSNLLRRTLSEGIELAYDTAADLWPANTDANQLEAAILNLSINARDAMPEGGRLTISTANRVVGPALGTPSGDLEPGDYVVLTVADTGVGMTEEVLSRVFDPFFTTKPIGQGTGLGLSMVYGFAKQIGGSVQIDSRIGRGTSVELYLPRATTTVIDTPAPEMQPQPQPSAGKSILIVEDNAAIRMFLTERLDELGYKVLSAADGLEGSTLLASEQPIHLLISDIGLPGLNGRAMAQAARQTRPGLKIIFFSGYAVHVPGDAASEKALKGAIMIRKPFDLNDLEQKIAEQFALN